MSSYVGVVSQAVAAASENQALCVFADLMVHNVHKVRCRDSISIILIFYTNKNVALIFSVTICVQKQLVVHRHGVYNRCFYK